MLVLVFVPFNVLLLILSFIFLGQCLCLLTSFKLSFPVISCVTNTLTMIALSLTENTSNYKVLDKLLHLGFLFKNWEFSSDFLLSLGIPLVILWVSIVA